MRKIANILDWPKPSLDPAIWNSGQILKPEVKQFIIDFISSFAQANNFKDTSAWITEVKFVGSLTTNCWNSNSDMDIHIAVDLPKFVEVERPEMSEKEASDYLDEIRKQVDQVKAKVPGTEHPTEIYFETEFTTHASQEFSGTYSVLQDAWTKYPHIVDQTFDIEKLHPDLLNLAKETASELDAAFGEIKRDVADIKDLNETINDWPEEQRSLFEKKLQARLDELEAEIKGLVDLREDVAEKRKHYKALSEQEVRFKYLQKYFYMHVLTDLKTLLKQSPELSVKDIPVVENIMQQANLKEAGNVIDVNGVRVFKNPSFEQAENIWEKSKENFPEKTSKHIRYVIDPSSSDLFIWDAFGMHHTPIMAALGIPDIGYVYDYYAGDILSFSDIESVFEQQDKMKSQVTASRHEDSAEGRICIDFDETIAEDKHNGTIGQPEPNAKAALEKLKADGWYIIIFSHRSTTEYGEDQIKEFMDKHDLPYDEIYTEKPNAEFFIDDRAITFTTWQDVLEKVETEHLPEKKAALNLPTIDPTTFNITEPYALFIGTQMFSKNEGIDLFDVYGQHPMITEHNARPTVTLDALIKENIPVIGKAPRAGNQQPIQDISRVVKKASTYGDSAWISPWGEINEFSRESHEDWIVSHGEPDEGIYQTEDPLGYAIEKGWSRFGDMGFTETGLHVKDIRNIPPVIFTYVTKFSGKNKKIVISDLSGQYVHMSVDEFVLGQGAVNKVLQQKRMQTTAKLGSEYDFSSTHFLLPKELSEKIIRWAVEEIPESYIVHDSKDPGTKGIQIDSHITLKYGLKTNEFSEIENALIGEKAPHIKFNKTSFFEPEGKDYDVVIIPVESEDLQKLNEKLCSQVEHEDLQFKEYHPHVTVVYVKRGKGKEFDGKDIITGEELELPVLIFSPKEGEKRELQLAKATEKKASIDDSYWVDPDGNEYPLGEETHMEWVELNEEMLMDKGMPIRDDIENEMKSLFELGWTRVIREDSDSKYQFALHIRNLNKVPVGADEFISRHFDPRQLIIVDDEQHRSVEISDPFPTLQKAINKFSSLKESSFMPSNSDAAPSNDWSGDVGWPGNEEMDPVWPRDDGENFYSPMDDRPREKSVWWKLLNMFKKQQPISKKDVVPVKEAGLGSAGQYWFDPNGKFYLVDLPSHNHTEWIQQNAGINNITQAIEKGWIRARKDGDKGVIHLASLRNIPDFINDFILKLNAEETFIEDSDNNYIKIYKEDWLENGIQQTINKALSEKRMQTAKQASSNVFMLDDVGTGLQTKALKDPTPEQAANLFNNARGEIKMLRWASDVNGHVYMWDAYHIIHYHAMKQIPADWGHDVNTGILHSAEDASKWARRFQKDWEERTLMRQRDKEKQIPVTAKQWVTPTEHVNQPGMDWGWADYIYNYVDEVWQDLLHDWMNLDPKNYVKPVILIEKIYEDDGSVSAWVHIEFVNTAGKSDAYMKLVITGDIHYEPSYEPEGVETTESLENFEIEVLDYGKSDELEKTSKKYTKQDSEYWDAILAPFIADVKKDILSHINLKDFEVQDAQVRGKDIAEFQAGSAGSGKPLIYIDTLKIEKISKKEGIDFGYAIVSSIVHELGHALQEIDGLPYDEDQAENFARDYMDFGKVEDFSKQEKESSYGPTNYKGPSVADELYQDSPYRMNVTYSPEEDEELMDQNGKGGYPNRWMSRHRGPYYTNEGKVIKMLEETSAALSKKDIEKNALRGPIFIWLSPDGKEFDTPQHSHGAWVKDNKEMLEKQYSLKRWPLDWDTGADVEWLISKGWVRVTGYLPNEMDLNVADINNIPEAAERLVWREQPEVVIVEDLYGNDDSFDKEDYSKGLIKHAAISGQVINNILKLIQQTGGATYNLSKGNLVGTDAYAVAIYPDREQIVGHTIDFDDLEQYLDQNQDLLNNPNNSFGAWGSGGKTYFDVVSTIPNKEQAMELGKKYNQLAIFSLKDMVEIPLEKVASLKIAGQVTRLHTPNGEEFRVFKNPTPNQAEQIFNKSHEYEMRAVGTGEDVYMWDGYYGGHYDVMEQMGLLEHHGGEMSIYNPAQAREIANRFAKKSVMAKLAAAVSDSEQQKYYDEIYSDRWRDDSSKIDGGNEYYDWSELGSNDYPNPKDEEKEHVYMDQLDDPAKANFPAGLPEYWVTFYDANPQGSDEGGI